MAVTYRFLFDECLSADLVGLAHSRGFEATHVNFIDLRGASDRVLSIIAVERGMIFATNNAKDYRRIYAQLDLHPGLVVILPSVRPDRQETLFAAVLDCLNGLSDAVNLLIEVDDSATVTVSDWSRDW